MLLTATTSRPVFERQQVSFWGLGSMCMPFVLLRASLMLMAAFAMWGAIAPSTALAERNYVYVPHISDVPGKLPAVPGLWRPDRQLYVKGRTNINPARLDEIGVWLRDNAKNWTVIIADDSTGEKVVDDDGNTLVDFEAANYAVGHSLFKNPGFAQLVEPRIVARNGAALLILVNEKKFTYYPGDAQRLNGFDQRAFVGGLDRFALEDMAKGLNFVDAVRDTIKNIDSQLGEKLDAEQRVKQKLINVATAHYNYAKAALDRLSVRTEEYGSRFPSLSGDLARPPVKQYESALSAIQPRIVTNPVQVAQEVSELGARIADSLRAMDEYPNDIALIDEAQNRFTKAKKDRFASEATDSLKEAEARLQEAKTAYDQGARRYHEALTLFSTKIEEVEKELAVAAARSDFSHALLPVAVFTPIILILVGLGLLAWLRIPAKAKADELLLKWKKALDGKSGPLFALLDRARLQVGTDADADARFAGETREEARAIVKEVDELFIGQSVARQTFDRARALIRPPSGLPLVNVFRPKPYWQVQEILSGPVAFQPRDPLKLLERDGKHVDALLGEMEHYPAEEVPLERLADEFDSRLVSVQARLATFEGSWSLAASEIERLRTVLEGLELSRKEVPVLKAASLYANLIPAARAAALAAEERAVRDPLGSIEGPLASALRMGTQAVALAHANEQLRSVIAPRLLKIAEFFKTHKIRDAWVRAGIAELDARIEQLGSDATERDIASDIGQIEEKSATLLKQAEAAVATLAALTSLHRDREERGEKLEASRLEVLAKINAVLADSKNKLPLEADAVLKEQGHEPERFLRIMEAQVEIARGVLMNGDTAAAHHAIELGGEAVASYDLAIAQSLEIAGTFLERKTTLRREAKQLLSEMPRAAAILNYLLKHYVPSALLLVDSPDGSAVTVSDNITEFEAALRRIAELLAAAEANVGKAALFKAGAQLDQAGVALGSARMRLAEIGSRAGELRVLEQDNGRTLATFAQQCEALAPKLEERTATTTSLDFLADLRARLSALQEAASTAPRDPVGVQKKIEAFAIDLEEAEARLLNDRDTHDEMLRALRAAEAHVALARDSAGSSAFTKKEVAPATQAALAEIDAAARRFEAARLESRPDHGDWAQLLAIMTEAGLNAARAGSLLRGELEAANPAIERIQAAAAAVLRGASWIGEYGIRVPDAPGSEDLANAQSLLTAGLYAHAEVAATRALNFAESAYHEAETKIKRRTFETAQRKIVAQAKFAELQRLREWRRQQ